jgi:O-antigen ligase
MILKLKTLSLNLIKSFRLKYDYLVVLNILLLSIAVIEPSPSDIIFPILLLFAYKNKIFELEKFKRLKLCIFFLAIYGVISSLSLINAPMVLSSTRFLLITIYLMVYALFIFFYASDKNYGTLIKAYIISSTVAAILGIIGYCGYFTQYLTYDPYRTQALFKDPNVFGPFLVPTILILMDNLKARKIININLLLNLMLLSINTIGLILSFSRGAWVSLIVGVLTYFLLSIKKINYKKLLIIAIAVSAVILTIWFVALSDSWRSFFVDRLKFKAYDSIRFKSQSIGFSMSFDKVLGYGPGQFENIVEKSMGESVSAHSIYARTLLENGLIGFICLMSALVYIIVKLFILYLKYGSKTKLDITIVLAVLIGIFVNGIVVDTLHWRHMWLFIGLGLSIINEQLSLVSQDHGGGTDGN